MKDLKLATDNTNTSNCVIVDDKPHNIEQHWNCFGVDPYRQYIDNRPLVEQLPMWEPHVASDYQRQVNEDQHCGRPTWLALSAIDHDREQNPSEFFNEAMTRDTGLFRVIDLIRGKFP